MFDNMFGRVLGLSRKRSSIELTLQAAFHDLDDPRPDIRGVAIRNLGPALLDELGLRPPVLIEQIEHPRLADALFMLDQSCTDPAPQNAAMARIALAQLGAETAWTRAQEAIATVGDDDAAMFFRECGVIALSMLGGATSTFLAQPNTAANIEARARAAELRERILADLTERLDDPRDDVRFQLGPALIEVGGPAVEPRLLAALAREPHPEVRSNLISALAQLDPPSPATCDALAQVLVSDEGAGWIGWEAALALTGARRPEGAARLLVGLRSRETRDLALEALALLGEAAGPDAPAAVRVWTRGLTVPTFTKVRAAYALARTLPSDPAGRALLDRLAKHPRPAVREAVAEARQLLVELGSAPDPTDRGAYRREQ